ncbi:MAG: hypothetical protein GOU97_00665 [Nanoarchaeota archaeon]|nr:hypothetical protein [Nanoarchaeota archaeon]
MFESMRFNTIDNLFVLYGLDASGKSTQARIVKKKLEGKGYEVHHIKTPSNGVWGTVQRGLLVGGSKKRAAVFGFLDFLSLMPEFGSARKTDNEVRNISIDDLTNGYLDDIFKKLEKANASSKVIYLMERHPLFDAITYFGPKLKKNWYYRAFSFLFPKPGLAIRMKTSPEQSFERAKKRSDDTGQALEITENLEALVEADDNLGEVGLRGVKFTDVDTSDEVEEEESAEEIVEVIGEHKKKTERNVKKGITKTVRKAKKILKEGLDYLRREDQ